MSSPKNKTASGSPVSPDENLSFEEAARRLQQIVEQLEGGQLSLEESLARFEDGVKLARGAQETLTRAERRVEELLGFDEAGNPIVRDFAPSRS